MLDAERDDILVADFECQSTCLREGQMVRMGRHAFADETGEFPNFAQVRLVALPSYGSDGKAGFVDARAMGYSGRR
jgi:hypothetical protein